jgi:hypothetical protein
MFTATRLESQLESSTELDFSQGHRDELEHTATVYLWPRGSTEDSTGQRFVVDPRIQTPLTILSPAPLSTQAIWAAFTALLDIHGLEARRVGRDLRITPLQPTSTAAVSEPARIIATSVGKSKSQPSSDTVLADPVFAHGAQRGLRVSPGINAIEFDRLGLDYGDVLLTVNGTALNDPAHSKQILDAALEATGDVTVKVERAGQIQELILYTARL